MSEHEHRYFPIPSDGGYRVILCCECGDVIRVRPRDVGPQAQDAEEPA